jgi:hypothetical protein
MTLTQASANLRLFATVTPADPLASGGYDIGSGSKRHTFPAANQVFSVKVSAQDGVSTLDIQAGDLTVPAGAVQAGGDGLDPDGQAVNFDTIYALRIINTGAVSLFVEQQVWTGSDSLLTQAEVPAGGDLVMVSPAGSAISACTFEFGDAGTVDAAWEAVFLGKTPA